MHRDCRRRHIHTSPAARHTTVSDVGRLALARKSNSEGILQTKSFLQNGVHSSHPIAQVPIQSLFQAPQGTRIDWLIERRRKGAGSQKQRADFRCREGTCSRRFLTYQASDELAAGYRTVHMRELRGPSERILLFAFKLRGLAPITVPWE